MNDFKWEGEGADKLQTLLKADRDRLRTATPIPYTEALAHCRAWIVSKGATTRCAAVLKALLLSLADEGATELADVRVLDTDRRLWLLSILSHLPNINDAELRYAAGA